MGTTFVAIGDRGFWIRDSILELWLRFLALHIEDPLEPASFATRIRDQWPLASRGFFNGCVPERLGEGVSTPEGEALVRAAIHSLLGALAAAPTHLDKDVLNLMGFIGGAFTADVETRRLVEVGQAYLDLLDGEIATGSSETSFMPGGGSPGRWNSPLQPAPLCAKRTPVYTTILRRCIDYP